MCADEENRTPGHVDSPVIQWEIQNKKGSIGYPFSGDTSPFFGKLRFLEHPECHSDAQQLCHACLGGKSSLFFR
jgi:hypothetical protein